MKNFLLSCIAIVNALHVGLASRGKIGKQSMSLQSIIQSNPSPAICFACCEHGPKSTFSTPELYMIMIDIETD
jgi:hypothetical protein